MTMTASEMADRSAAVRRARADERNAAIRREVDGGLAKSDVARKFGVSLTTVYRALEAAPPQPGADRSAAVRRARADERNAAIRREVDRGMAKPDVARKFGVSLTTVYRALEAAPPQPPGAGQTPPPVC